jgi:site-specific DNA-methyltransferase (adenine-specific)
MHASSRDLAGGAATIVHGEAMEVLQQLPDGCAGLVYVDPPFNTGRRRTAVLTRTQRAENGHRVGFAGHRYEVQTTRGDAFDDGYGSYLEWLRPRLEQSRRILARHGTLYFHIDPRESHYCKLLLDSIFGRRSFLNEIVWAYDYGARTTRRWAAKHDVILVYVRDPKRYHYDASAVDRVPYMAPALQTAERAARGKLPTDVWWNTIVPTASRERTGYPTQKPLAILRRIVAASSRRGDLVVDWCAGSGTAGAAAAEMGRRFLLVDQSGAAVEVMGRRLAGTPELRIVAGAIA